MRDAFAYLARKARTTGAIAAEILRRVAAVLPTALRFLGRATARLLQAILFILQFVTAAGDLDRRVNEALPPAGIERQFRGASPEVPDRWDGQPIIPMPGEADDRELSI